MAAGPKIMNAQEWGLLIFLSVLWGAGFFFAGVAVRELPPLTVVLARVALAALFLLPVFWYYKHKLPKSWSDWKPFVVMGLLNNVMPFGFFFAGQTFITVGLTSIMNAMTPLFTILVMAGFREERITLSQGLGVLVSIAGVIVIQEFDEAVGWDQTFGIALCLCGALSFGFAALWGRRTLGGVAPLKSATCQLISSSFILVLVVCVIDQPWALELPSQTTIMAIMALAVFGTAIAYIVFFEILVRAGASNVMLVTLLIPITAIILGNLFLDETVEQNQVMGTVLIGLGLLFIDGRIFRIGRK